MKFQTDSTPLKPWLRKLRGGLIPAVPVPFDDSGRIHWPAQENYAKYMARQPVKGVAVWAHTGRGLRLEREQRDEVLRCWRASLPRGRILIAGVGANAQQTGDSRVYMDEALRMADRALELGADALLIYPPTIFRQDEKCDDRTFVYHLRLAELDAPLILFYLYEAAGGISYSSGLLRRLLDLPGVIGIKMATLDSVLTFQEVATQIHREQPKKLLITGEDRFLGYSLMCGAQAALIGMGAACCRLQADLIRSYHQGKAQRFLALSEKVDLLSSHTFVQPMEGYIRRMLWVLVHQGVIPMEAANDPWGPGLPASEFAALGTALQQLGKAAK